MLGLKDMSYSTGLAILRLFLLKLAREGECNILVQVLIDSIFIFSTKCSFKVGQTILIVTQKEGIL